MLAIIHQLTFYHSARIYCPKMTLKKKEGGPIRDPDIERGHFNLEICDGEFVCNALWMMNPYLLLLLMYKIIQNEYVLVINLIP